MEEVKVYSTWETIEDFKKSVLWSDITRELKSWKHGFTLEMMGIVDDAAKENPSTAQVLLHMGDLNGRQKAVDYFLSILDVFQSLVEAQKEDKETKSDGG